MSVWGAIEPAESVQSRLRLDFGLRPAILAFNDWAVPGLGGAFFVRQLTWGCLGIFLADQMQRPTLAARIAESIEALASWIALKHGQYDKDDRVQGKRKLRNLDKISFDAVSNGGAYVTVPFRRAATAALPGLGFCSSTQYRFNSLQLAPAGIELAGTVLRDSGAAETLRKWIALPKKETTQRQAVLVQALLPGRATSEECRLVHDRLMAHPERAVLIGLLAPLAGDLSDLQAEKDIAAFLAQISDPVQRARLDACFVFERVRASALKSAQTLADAIRAKTQPWSALATSSEIQQAFRVFGDHCAALSVRLNKLAEIPPGIREFCEEQRSSLDLEPRIRALAARLPQVFTSQPGNLDRGMGYTDRLVAEDAIDPSDNEVAPTAVLVPRPLLRLKRLYQETLEGLAHEA